MGVCFSGSCQYCDRHSSLPPSPPTVRRRLRWKTKQTQFSRTGATGHLSFPSFLPATPMRGGDEWCKCWWCGFCWCWKRWFGWGWWWCFLKRQRNQPARYPFLPSILSFLQRWWRAVVDVVDLLRNYQPFLPSLLLPFFQLQRCMMMTEDGDTDDGVNLFMMRMAMVLKNILGLIPPWELCWWGGKVQFQKTASAAALTINKVEKSFEFKFHSASWVWDANSLEENCQPCRFYKEKRSLL